MEESTTDRIEKQIVVHAPRDQVWRTITDPVEFGRLFSFEMNGAFVPGEPVSGTVTLPEYEGISFHLTVERMEPDRLFSWRWHPGAIERGVDFSAEPTTLVEVELQDHPEGTLVRLLESGFDGIPLARRASAFKLNGQGWSQLLEAIKQSVEAAV
jgi:uncharacterized protein YndB with AHSA1/START domain